MKTTKRVAFLVAGVAFCGTLLTTDRWRDLLLDSVRSHTRSAVAQGPGGAWKVDLLCARRSLDRRLSLKLRVLYSGPTRELEGPVVTVLDAAGATYQWSQPDPSDGATQTVLMDLPGRQEGDMILWLLRKQRRTIRSGEQIAEWIRYYFQVPDNFTHGQLLFADAPPVVFSITDTQQQASVDCGQ